MAKLTLSEAAREWGITRQTLRNREKKGDLTVDRSDKKAPKIDTSEMMRVFGEAGQKAAKAENSNQHLPQADQSELVDALRDQIASLERQLERANENESQLIQTLNSQTRLLSDLREGRSVWDRLFGGKASRK